MLPLIQWFMVELLLAAQIVLYCIYTFT